MPSIDHENAKKKVIQLACGNHPPYPYLVSIEPINYLKSYSAVHYVPEPDRRQHTNYNDLRFFTLAMSSQDNITASQSEQFWASLIQLENPVMFEVVANSNEIVFQIVCHVQDSRYLAKQLLDYFPNSDINPEGSDPDYFDDFYHAIREQSDVMKRCSFELGLDYVSHYPLRIITSLNPGPLGILINALDTLGEMEGAVIQALVSPTRLDWIEIFSDWLKIKPGLNVEYYRLMRKKLADQPFLCVALRTSLYGNVDKERCIVLIKEIMKFFNQFRDSNSFFMLPPRSDDDDTLFKDINYRESHRVGMLLNVKELGSICHLPTKYLLNPKLRRANQMTGKAPEIALQEGIIIGINEFHGKRREVAIPHNLRNQHAYIVGATNMGKSILMLNMIKQDIEKGEGVGVIDPHGDLIEDVLPIIPEYRLKDVSLFDPSDIEYPIGLNLLTVSGFRAKELVCSELLSIFQRMFDAASWGDNIEQVLRMCILSLLEVGGYTLRDIRRLIINDMFRSKVVSQISDPDLVEFWTVEFPSYSKATISAVQRRLSRLLSSSIIRNILSQKESKLDFQEIMDGKMILLCNLSKGKIGQDNSDLFGRLIVTELQLSAMSRADRPKEERQPFFLYVDEFQNFLTSSFEEILPEARKYQLCMTLAHQFTSQLSKPIHDAVFGNVGSLIVFRVGSDDAQDLQKKMGRFTYENILNLEPYHAYVKIGKAMDTFSMVTFPPPVGGDPSIAERVRNASRRKYATPREEVEAYLRDGQTPAGRKSKGSNKPKNDDGMEDSDVLDFYETE